MWVNHNVLNHIIGETDAQAMWTKLEQLYARKTENNKMFLIKQLLALKYTNGISMTITSMLSVTIVIRSWKLKYKSEKDSNNKGKDNSDNDDIVNATSV